MSLSFILVGLGGALGALCRGICTDLLKRLPWKGLPFPTLLINIVACAIAGGVMAASPSESIRTLLSMGFLGGFSTLSTMNYEAVTYFVHRFYGRCAAYLALSFASCLGACAAGIAVVSYLL